MVHTVLYDYVSLPRCSPPSRYEGGYSNDRFPLAISRTALPVKSRKRKLGFEMESCHYGETGDGKPSTTVLAYLSIAGQASVKFRSILQLWANLFTRCYTVAFILLCFLSFVGCLCIQCLPYMVTDFERSLTSVHYLRHIGSDVAPCGIAT